MRRHITVKISLDSTRDEMPDTNSVKDTVKQELESSFTVDAKVKVINTTERGYEVEADEDDDTVG